MAESVILPESATPQHIGFHSASRVRYAGLRPPLTRNETHSNFNRG